MSVRRRGTAAGRLASSETLNRVNDVDDCRLQSTSAISVIQLLIHVAS